MVVTMCSPRNTRTSSDTLRCRPIVTKRGRLGRAYLLAVRIPRTIDAVSRTSAAIPVERVANHHTWLFIARPPRPEDYGHDSRGGPPAAPATPEGCPTRRRLPRPHCPTSLHALASIDQDPPETACGGDWGATSAGGSAGAASCCRSSRGVWGGACAPPLLCRGLVAAGADAAGAGWASTRPRATEPNAAVTAAPL